MTNCAAHCSGGDKRPHTDRQTDRQTCIKAPSRSLKNQRNFEHCPKLRIPQFILPTHKMFLNRFSYDIGCPSDPPLDNVP